MNSSSEGLESLVIAGEVELSRPESAVLRISIFRLFSDEVEACGHSRESWDGPSGERLAFVWNARRFGLSSRMKMPIKKWTIPCWVMRLVSAYSPWNGECLQESFGEAKMLDEKMYWARRMIQTISKCFWGLDSWLDISENHWMGLSQARGCLVVWWFDDKKRVSLPLLPWNVFLELGLGWLEELRYNSMSPKIKWWWADFYHAKDLHCLAEASFELPNCMYF